MSPRKKQDAEVKNENENDEVMDDLADVRDEIQRLREENERLMSALSDQARANKEITRDLDGRQAVPNTPAVQIVKTGGAALSFSVLDRFGNPKEYYLETNGQTIWLSTDQIAELKEKAPKWFKKGYIMVKGDESNRDAVVGSAEDVLKLSIGEIPGRIEKVNDPASLMRIFVELDSSRFTTEDEKGEALTDEHGNIAAHVREFDAKEQVLFHTVASRIEKLTGQVVQLSDG